MWTTALDWVGEEEFMSMLGNNIFSEFWGRKFDVR